MLATSEGAQQSATEPSEDSGGDRVARQIAGDEQKKEEEKKKGRKRTRLFRWEDHPSLHLGKGTHIDFRARVQEDITDTEANVDETDRSAIDLARRRIGIAGEIMNLVEFQIERELRGDREWRDVYVDYRQFTVARLRGGKFKLPFSLDENTSPTNLDFVYRSLAATYLAPGRDRGVMVHGRVLHRMFRYELGAFDHDGRNARTSSPERVFGGQTVAGRITAEPLRSAKSPFGDLSVGLAFTSSDLAEGFPALRGRTVLDASFFKSEYPVNGPRRRLGVEAQWRPGPFSVKSEYIRVADERRGESVEDSDLSPILGLGWYVSGTWALTGESKAAGLDSPRRPIFRGGFGALEVAGRLESLRFKSGSSGEAPSTSPRADVILGNGDRAATFGVNWYLNRWIKVQANVIRETISDPSRGPLPSRAGFWSRAVRFQFSL